MPRKPLRRTAWTMLIGGLAGTPRVVAGYTRGPLISVPLLITMLGILFFFPRFTHSWAQLSTHDWLRKLLRMPPAQ